MKKKIIAGGVGGFTWKKKSFGGGGRSTSPHVFLNGIAQIK